MLVLVGRGASLLIGNVCTGNVLVVTLLPSKHRHPLLYDGLFMYSVDAIMSKGHYSSTSGVGNWPHHFR